VAYYPRRAGEYDMTAHVELGAARARITRIITGLSFAVGCEALQGADLGCLNWSGRAWAIAGVCLPVELRHFVVGPLAWLAE
jgi:hypothetical protein